MFRALAACTLLVALVGCGGADEDPDVVGSDLSGYGSIQALAVTARCDPAEAMEPMMFAAETTTCTLPSSEVVTINWFNSNEARDQYVDLGTSNGAIYLQGDRWAIECQNETQREQVAETTDGDLVG